MNDANMFLYAVIDLVVHHFTRSEQCRVNDSFFLLGGMMLIRA